MVLYEPYPEPGFLDLLNTRVEAERSSLAMVVNRGFCFKDLTVGF
jgi:hypothetical protein